MSSNTYQAGPVGTPVPRTLIAEPTSWSGGHTHRRISWAAILGGVILVVAVQLLLTILGAGVGLGTVHTNAGTTPSAATLGIGVGIWWVVTSCLALLAGGYVSAWLAGIEIGFDGVLHGLITWAVSTLASLVLLSSAVGGVVGGGASAMGSLTSSAASGVSEAARPIAQAAGVTPDMIQGQARAYLEPTDPDPMTMDAASAQKATAADLATYLGGGSDAATAKERIINIMAMQMKISHDDAAKRFDATEAKIKQAHDQAVQAAKNAADESAAAASKTSFIAFSVLLLGLISAGIGGSLAVQKRMLVLGRASDGRIV